MFLRCYANKRQRVFRTLDSSKSRHTLPRQAAHDTPTRKDVQWSTQRASTVSRARLVVGSLRNQYRNRRTKKPLANMLALTATINRGLAIVGNKISVRTQFIPALRAVAECCLFHGTASSHITNSRPGETGVKVIGFPLRIY